MMSATQLSERPNKYSREQWGAALILAAAKLTTPANEWQQWVRRLFPAYVSAGFAERHEQLWAWAWAIQKGQSSDPFVAIWPRGGAKSTSAELISAMVGMRGTRTHTLYVCETQEQADNHVATIAALLEDAGVERLLNKYGHSRGWRRNRLRASDGYTVDALGLDTAVRGIKVENERPDLIILDDIDGVHDTDKITNKKEETLTTSVLPAGSNDMAVLAVQNLIHSNSIFARLANGKADYLSGRIVSGPYPALTEFEYHAEGGEWAISGTPTWAGQDLEACLRLLKNIGPRAFLRECQHAIGEREGALWTRDLIDAGRVIETPEFVSVVVAVDPATTSTDTSDEMGIIGGGASRERHGYVLEDKTRRGTPTQCAREAIAMYYRLKANKIVIEANNGGEWLRTVFNGIDKNVPISLVSATRNKTTRAEPVQMLYEEGRMHHVGTLAALEDEMTNWVPMDGKSPNRIDGLVWLAHGLGLVNAVSGVSVETDPHGDYRG